MSLLPLTVHSCVCRMNELTKVDKRLCVYFSAAALLYVACKISINGFSDKLMAIVTTILGLNFDRCCIVSFLKPELN